MNELLAISDRDRRASSRRGAGNYRIPQGVTTESQEPLIATQLLRFLASPEAAQAVENKGLQLCLKRPSKGILRRSLYCSPLFRSHRFCLGSRSRLKLLPKLYYCGPQGSVRHLNQSSMWLIHLQNQENRSRNR